MRLFLAWLALGLVHASGSSTVRATTVHVHVEYSSPSVIFTEAGDEGAWHRDWRRENQVVVDRAAAQLEGALRDKALKGMKLVMWEEGLPSAWAGAGPEDPGSPEQVCRVGPCRIRLVGDGPRLGALAIEIAVAKAPERTMYAELQRVFDEALSQNGTSVE